MLDTALELHAAGLAVLPAACGKRPAVEWKQYQAERPSEADLARWFGEGAAEGLGVICGAVSGGLELLELEGRAVADGALQRLEEAVDAAGLRELWDRLANGWSVVSPSGGRHFYARLADAAVRGSTKIAAKATHETLAETRGEGGWVICPPSGGSVHPSGEPWRRLTGGPAGIPTITKAERDDLHAVIRTVLDERPVAAPPPGPVFAPLARGIGGVSPGNDYTARTTWADVLTEAGWRHAFDRGHIAHWTRPGKTGGTSATTGYGDGDWLYVFTSSTVLESERTYDRFGFYAAWHHGGDHRTAAKAPQGLGYGREPHRPVATLPAAAPPTAVPAIEGNLATVHQLPAPATADTMVLSEDGHAQALIAEHGQRIRYCPERGRWLAWDGVRWVWQPTGGGTVREYAKKVAREMPEDDAGVKTFKRKALSAVGTTGALRQAETDPAITVRLDQLDADPWALNTPDGVLDLRTGQLTPATPEGLHTKVTACAPDGSADPSHWLGFLDTTFGGDAELVGYLQRLIGYTAVGEIREHLLPFAVGSGGNGKGVFLETLLAVLGDYSTTAPNDFLMARGERHETELARMAGVRLVVASEVNEGDRFDEKKVKLLTGGDTITARFMRQDHFTFQPTAKIVLMGNHRPEVRAGGRSFWRRLRLIPFHHEVPKDQEIPDLQGILAREHGPAVLAWIAAGAAEYASSGLREPDSVKVATAEYEADQDTVSRFVADLCHLGGGQHVQVPIATVRAAYEQFCRDGGETPVSAKAFGQALARRGVESVKGSKGVRRYAGITVLTADEEGAGSATGSGAGSTFTALVQSPLGGLQ